MNVSADADLEVRERVRMQASISVYFFLKGNRHQSLLGSCRIMFVMVQLPNEAEAFHVMISRDSYESSKGVYHFLKTNLLISQNSMLQV